MDAMIRAAISLSLLAVLVLPSSAAPLSPEELQQKVETVREDAGLVALGAVIANADGDILGLAVDGARVQGKRGAVQQGDAWHIGSNTKMLTALLYGRLVEQGEASWGATLPELLPDLADEMDPAWGDVTIEHLLSHRSGLAANPGMMWFLTSRGSNDPVETQRTALARGFLTKPPAGETGTFTYSNLGYMIAGAALDRIALRLGHENYETLFLSTLVLQNEGWGFGPPPTGIEGHAKGLFGGLKGQGTGSGADNPAALAPAGTLHVPLAAHARFVSGFLEADEAEQKLLTPYPTAGSDYALGWGVSAPGPHGRLFAHNGSNTMWLSSVYLLPDAGLVVIVNTNSFSDEGVAAVNKLARELADAFAE
jgi:CubicO group peptidase (beta-lactamase class C family)